MHQALQRILDWFLPPRGDVETARLITEEILANLLHPTLAREAWIFALYPYKDARIRALIKSVKFYGERPPSAIESVVGGFLIEFISDKRLFSGWNTPLVVPIPASPKRLKERGYNQVERFAERIFPALHGSAEYATDVLKRSDRESQVRIPRTKRTHNIEGAFFVPNPELVRGKQIILLDDVVESGATMKDARRALLSAGASDVIGIALTH